MTSEATIRAAHGDDIAAMQDVERAAGALFAGIGMDDVAADPPLEEEVLAEYVRDGRAWVVEAGERVVGYALADEIDGQGHLEQVSVDPAFGRRGLGRRLIETVCGWARDRGFSRLTLITFRDVPWNGPYYAALGFDAVPDANLGPEMRTLRAREAEHGLDVDAREVMGLALGEFQIGRGRRMDALETIDGFIAEQMALGNTPGLSIAIVQGNKVIHSRGYGYADLARSIPMTETTRVVIGSTTKALTALAVMQLVEAGTVDLGAPVQRYLPEFQLANREAAAVINVRQILTHTAGLPPTPIDGPSFLYSREDPPDAVQRYIEELETASPVWEPGGGWLYSNDGYVLAGRIVEVISGRPFEEYMARHVLEPIGIEDASFAPVEPPCDAAVAYDYDGTMGAFPSFFPHSLAANAAGMLMMTAEEAARWLRCVLDGGEIDGQRVISRDGMAKLTSPQARLSQTAQAAGRQVAEAYGFGWMTGDLMGRRLLAHGGSAITMGSIFLLLPDEGLGVAVLANSSTEVTGVVAEGALRLLCGEKPVRSFPTVDGSARPDPETWRRLEGIYAATAPQNAVTSLLPIEIAGDRLRARTFPGDEARRPGNFYFVPNGENEFVLFGRGKTGGIATFDPGATPIRATVQGAPLRQVSAHLHSGYVLNWSES